MQTVEGTLFGIVVAVMLVALYGIWLAVPGGPLGPNSPAREAILGKITGLGLDVSGLLVVGVFYSIFHSGLEEYYWRWFVFGRMQRFMPWFWAAVVSSLGFMAHHVLLLGMYFGYDSIYCWLGSLGVAVGGFYWCWLYKRTDSIWGPWIGHGLVDAAIFTIGMFILAGIIIILYPVKIRTFENDWNFGFKSLRSLSLWTLFVFAKQFKILRLYVAKSR